MTSHCVAGAAGKDCGGSGGQGLWRVRGGGPTCMWAGYGAQVSQLEEEANLSRKGPGQAVGVQHEGAKVFGVADGGGNGAGEVVAVEEDVLKDRDGEQLGGDGALQAVVVQHEVAQEAELADLGGDAAPKG